MPRLEPLEAVGEDSILFTPREWTALGDLLGLSPRELEIVQGVFDDRTEGSIASGLGISHHTVHTYLARIYRKVSASSRTQLVVRVMETYLGIAREMTSTRLDSESGSGSVAAYGPGGAL